MNAKAAKFLRKIGRNTHEDKRGWYSFNHISRGIVRALKNPKIFDILKSAKIKK